MENFEYRSILVDSGSIVHCWAAQGDRSGCVRANTPSRARLTYQLIETTYAGEEVWKNQDSSRWKPRAKDRQLAFSVPRQD